MVFIYNMLPSGVLLLTLDRIDANSLQATPSEAFFSGLFDSLLVSIYTPVKRQRPFHVREKYIVQKHNGIMTLLVFKPGNFFRVRVRVRVRVELSGHCILVL